MNHHEHDESIPHMDGEVTSADGTTISYTKLGDGPPLVMVHCVGVSRATTPQPTLPQALARHFTVYTYDRRGKGRSGNTPPYEVERELEDLGAMLDEAGGTALVYGFSSGATLALLAAEAGIAIRQLLLLEPPLMAEPDPEHTLAKEGQRRIDEDVAAAHRWFNTDIVGVPAEVLDEMPPPGGEDLANATTIVHELTFLPGTAAGRFARVQQPTGIFASDQTAPEMFEFADQLVEAMPNASKHILPGEWHGVPDEILTRAIVAFTAG